MPGNFCWKCGLDLPDNTRFCTGCKAEQETIPPGERPWKAGIMAALVAMSVCLPPLGILVGYLNGALKPEDKGLALRRGNRPTRQPQALIIFTIGAVLTAIAVFVALAMIPAPQRSSPG